MSEKGYVRCRNVVLAGGAWSSLFCRPLGIRLPQLKLLSTVFRALPTYAGPDVSVVAPGFSARKRLDGGYTMSAGLTAIAEIVPDSFRYFREFLPVLKDRAAYQVDLRFGKRFFDELLASRAGFGARASSPCFTGQRVLDPAPSTAQMKTAIRHLRARLPALGTLRVTHAWAGFFDVTPDALPVISAVSEMPGLIVSTGYSGHGFGLGLAAGELTAGLVEGGKAQCSTTSFSIDRFAKPD